MKKKPITVGIDFDGVLAYNPLRIFRSPVTSIKRNILGEKKTHFFIPKSPLEKAIWGVLHESSIFPAVGVRLLGELVKEQRIEAHLVTARYNYLQEHLFRWLDRHDLEKLFTSITVNQKDEQPHLYKHRVIEQQKFDYFIEDNLDIVSHVSSRTDTKVLWIYNILDKNHPYPYKFPYLEKALEHITS